MSTSSYSALALVLVAALSGCSTEVVPAPSFSLQVRTIGTAASPAVLLDAVEQLEIVIRPRMPARFVELPAGCSFDDCGGSQCCKYEAGAVTAFISAAGEYVIRFDAEWVRAHAQVTPTGFTVVAPIFATSTMDSPGALDPVAFANVIRGTDRIGIGSISLMWPLRNGGMQDLPVMCAPGFESECMNVDPSIPLDGGP